MPLITTPHQEQPTQEAASSSLLPTRASELVDILQLIPHPEGGFFREVYRSGSEPMSSRGQTDLHVQDPQQNLVVTANRDQGCRPDGDPRRNALTSIYWLPTIKSKTMVLSINRSDHVHYFLGGRPFVYHIYDPREGTLQSHVLGPDLRRGQVLQLPVRGGCWKCGEMHWAHHTAEDSVPTDDDDHQDLSTTTTTTSTNLPDYSLIAEAVGPGFDHYDFAMITAAQLAQLTPEQQTLLSPFLHRSAPRPGNEQTGVSSNTPLEQPVETITATAAPSYEQPLRDELFDGYYDTGALQEERIQVRLSGN